MLVSDLRLVWFEVGTFEHIQMGAKKSHNIVIEERQEAVVLLHRLKNMIINRLKSCVIKNNDNKEVVKTSAFTPTVTHDRPYS
jgi:hypothetical protein